MACFGFAAAFLGSRISHLPLGAGSPRAWRRRGRPPALGAALLAGSFACEGPLFDPAVIAGAGIVTARLRAVTTAGDPGGEPEAPCAREKDARGLVGSEAEALIGTPGAGLLHLEAAPWPEASTAAAPLGASCVSSELPRLTAGAPVDIEWWLSEGDEVRADEARADEARADEARADEARSESPPEASAPPAMPPHFDLQLRTHAGPSPALCAVDFDPEEQCLRIELTPALEPALSPTGEVVHVELLVRHPSGRVDFAERDACLLPPDALESAGEPDLL